MRKKNDEICDFKLIMIKKKNHPFKVGVSICIHGSCSCRVNLYPWVIFMLCQYMDHVNMRQPKPDTNNKCVNIR